MTLPPVVEAKGLVKDYGRTRAVDGLSFDLGPGRVLAMVGPNGAGKTTTLRALAGIVKPTEGEVRVTGLDVFADPVEAKRRLAWVPHDPQLFDALTVAEHLDFVAATWGVDDHREKAEALLERFDLLAKRDEPAHALSTGMRQKLALCCAAVHGPQLILLDEPMTGLDPRAIRTMKAWLREEAERGAAVVISSHLLGVVEDLCTDLLIVVEGRRRFFGDVAAAREEFTEERLEELFFRATEAEPGA